MSINSGRREFLGSTLFGGSAALAGAALVGTVAGQIGFVRQVAAAETSITQKASFRFDTAREETVFKTLQDLASAVEAKEPDVLAYVPYKSALEPDLVTFFEIYKDQAAMVNHGKQPHLAVLREAFGKGLFKPYAEGKPLKIERLEQLGGFIR